jgi:hypothetical protein
MGGPDVARLLTNPRFWILSSVLVWITTIFVLLTPH